MDLFKLNVKCLFQGSRLQQDFEDLMKSTFNRRRRDLPMEDILVSIPSLIILVSALL